MYCRGNKSFKCTEQKAGRAISRVALLKRVLTQIKVKGSHKKNLK